MYISKLDDEIVKGAFPDGMPVERPSYIRTDRDWRIARDRFIERLTYDEIATHYGVSTNRVRQIVVDVLQRMRRQLIPTSELGLMVAEAYEIPNHQGSIVNCLRDAIKRGWRRDRSLTEISDRELAKIRNLGPSRIAAIREHYPYARSNTRRISKYVQDRADQYHNMPVGSQILSAGILSHHLFIWATGVDSGITQRRRIIRVEIGADIAHANVEYIASVINDQMIIPVVWHLFEVIES